ncbi:MAG: lipoate protein ligase C-terminal domain-containing protein [Anaerolineaceae bacterium]
MNYYFLDKVSWAHSQALYHAAAYLQQECLFILRPSTPYVCIGFHQDAEQEIDLGFAKKNNIPIFRREVGGGAVYLDGEQLFYQLILNKNHSGIPQNKGELYRMFLEPVVETYREFGVPAQYKPVNDIIANGKKVSGNGAAEINDMIVIVGNFILDFNYEMMSKCLRVPDEKFRDKVYKTLQDNLSTFKRETGTAPETRSLGDSLARRYEAILGAMDWKTAVGSDLLAKAEELLDERHTTEWLLANDRRRPGSRLVKIREGVNVVQNMIKAPGGLIRVTAVDDNGVLRDVHISGDFFFYPAEKLQKMEQALNGVDMDPEKIQNTISAFYTEQGIESPGVLPDDIFRAVLPVNP